MHFDLNVIIQLIEKKEIGTQGNDLNEVKQTIQQCNTFII